MKINNSFSSIYFDLDSTLVDIEGLDEIANYYGKKADVVNLTTKSMAGDVKLEDVFALKLAIIRPHKKDFEKLGKLYIQHIVEDAKVVISVLKFLKKEVYIMSGNFYPAVLHLSNYLGIHKKNVYANNIHFDKQGNYLTFDSRGPLSVAGGKKSLMLILKREGEKVVFVGDGSTDAETRPPVDLFIGYGGVIVRKKILDLSDVFIKCKSLSAILPFIITQKEKNVLMKTKYRYIYLKGEKLNTDKNIVNNLLK